MKQSEQALKQNTQTIIGDLLAVSVTELRRSLIADMLKKVRLFFTLDMYNTSQYICISSYLVFWQYIAFPQG
jgi:hypothetical protein